MLEGSGEIYGLERTNDFKNERSEFVNVSEFQAIDLPSDPSAFIFGFSEGELGIQFCIIKRPF